MDEFKKKAQELLASCLREWGCYTEALNVSNGEDLESYEYDLRIIAQLLRFGFDTPSQQTPALSAAPQGVPVPEYYGDVERGFFVPAAFDRTVGFDSKRYSLPLYTAAPQVPEGWALVPVEPTPEMLASAARHDYYSELDPTWRSLWSAMLAAKPEPQA
ncbi:hypothetical protein ACW0US_07165 [Xanthomonas euvesicatoria]